MMLFIVLPHLGAGQATPLQGTSFSPCLLPSMIFRSTTGPANQHGEEGTELFLPHLREENLCFGIRPRPELLAQPTKGMMSVEMFAQTNLALDSSLASRTSQEASKAASQPGVILFLSTFQKTRQCLSQPCPVTTLYSMSASLWHQTLGCQTRSPLP